MYSARKKKGYVAPISIGIMVIFGVYFLSQYLGNTQTSVASVAVASGQTGSSVPTAPQPTSSSNTQSTSGLYADGSYTGSSANAYWGTVQVRAIIQGGKLTSVQILQYPSDHQASQYISSQALPPLQSEAIQSQSANVNIISGATFTSQAFQQSLGSALAQAQH